MTQMVGYVCMQGSKREGKERKKRARARARVSVSVRVRGEGTGISVRQSLNPSPSLVQNPPAGAVVEPRDHLQVSKVWSLSCLVRC
jgi:hypothetical protein